MTDGYDNWVSADKPKFTEEEIEFLAKMQQKYKALHWIMLWPLVTDYGCVMVSKNGWQEIQEREDKFKELFK